MAKKDELEQAQKRILDRAVTQNLPNSKLAFPTRSGSDVFAYNRQTIPSVVDRISSGNQESIFNATAARYAAPLQSPIETNFQISRNIQSPDFPQQNKLAASFATPFDAMTSRENLANKIRYSPSPFGGLSVAQNQAIAGSAESRQYTSRLEDIQQNRVLPEFDRRETMTATPFSQNEFGGRERTIPLPSGGQIYQTVFPEGKGYASITRTPEAVAQQQAQIAKSVEQATRYGEALARAKEIGAQNRKAAQEESIRRSSEFFASLNAERAARERARAEEIRSRGGSGKIAARRAQEFEIKAELESQRAANVGTEKRTPFFSWEPITMKTGEQYYPSGMGQYTKIAGAPSATQLQPSPYYSSFGQLPSSFTGPLAWTPFGQMPENQPETYSFTTRDGTRVPRRRRPFDGTFNMAR